MIWLPFANIRACLDVLTIDHVYDVVYEGMQCLRDIYTDNVNGRDVRAWRNHPQGLLFYVLAAEKEMRKRGMTGEPRVNNAFTWLGRNEPSMAPTMPSWYGDPAFHLAQRSHLIKVDPVHYARRLPLDTPLELPLIWPTDRRIAK